MRRAAKRDANEAEIVTALRAVGAAVRHISAPGVPDLLVGYRDTNYLLEVKSTKGKLTDDEQTFFDEWHERGHAAIVRNVDDALRVIGAIQ